MRVPHVRRRSRMRLGAKATAVIITLLLGAAISASCSADRSPAETAVTEEAARDRQANDARFTCLQRLGIDVQRGEDGSVTSRSTDEAGAAARDAAEETCDLELAEAGLVDPVDEEYLRVEYERSRALHDCLAAAGIDVIDDFPSVETYLERSEELELFAIYTDDGWRSAEAACPDEVRILTEDG